jgi:hypothetical protein
MNDPLKARRARLWANKGFWTRLTQDAYDYAIPNRQPTERIGEGQSRTVKLHDATAANLVFASAAQLRDDIAPPGQPLGRVRPSRLTRNRMLAEENGNKKFEATLSLLQDGNDVVNAMFGGGNFSSALLEACIDCHVSTGALLVLEGTRKVPALFASIPIEQIAIEVDMFGRETLIAWKQQLTLRAIADAFPKAQFSVEWRNRLKDKPDDMQELEQCFVRRPSGLAWDMYVYLCGNGGAEAPVQRQVFKSCPVIPMPFQRVPGEAYGRGPILTLLPSIKVLNAAQELQMKAFAIQMLGLWMYRKNGAFNPDTAQLAPGAFWKVDNTGGMFGPDIARLDPATGRMDLGAQLTTELRQQIATGLQRQQLPAGGTTPGSATEYMVREKEQLRSYRGAYGRMVEEFVPKLFWRCMEIAWNLGLVPRKFEFDQMLMQLDVLSPLAAAMRAQQFEPAFNYLGLLQQTGGDPDEYIDRDALYEAVAYETGVLTEFTKDADERAAYRAQKMQAALAAAAAQNAPPPAPPPIPGTAA